MHRDAPARGHRVRPAGKGLGRCGARDRAATGRGVGVDRPIHPGATRQRVGDRDTGRVASTGVREGHREPDVIARAHRGRVSGLRDRQVGAVHGDRCRVRSCAAVRARERRGVVVRAAAVSAGVGGHVHRDAPARGDRGRSAGKGLGRCGARDRAATGRGVGVDRPVHPGATRQRVVDRDTGRGRPHRRS